MAKLSDLKPSPSKKKAGKRLGRGLGSGKGTYSGRGVKGQKARSGGNIRPGFEGGRMPLIRQVPKMRGKGFSGKVRNSYEVKLSDIASHFGDNEVVNTITLRERGLTGAGYVKIIKSGDLNQRKVVIEGVKLTKGAKEEIEKAGGSIKE